MIRLKRLIYTNIMLLACLPVYAKVLRIDNILGDENEKAWVEQPFEMPAYPQSPEWIEFQVGDNNYHNKVYIDAKTMQRGKDNAVRFILRRLSPSGVENISYEGLLCKYYRVNTYAFGDTYNKRWIKSKKSAWRFQPESDVVHQQLHEIICAMPTFGDSENMGKLFHKYAEKNNDNDYSQRK